MQSVLSCCVRYTREAMKSSDLKAWDQLNTAMQLDSIKDATEQARLPKIPFIGAFLSDIVANRDAMPEHTPGWGGRTLCTKDI